MAQIKIKAKFSPADIKKILQKKLELIDQAIFIQLQIVGEKFVTNARNNHEYTDRSGNLTSSIGYMIKKDGETVVSNFAGNLIGQAKGIEVAEEVSKKFPKGWAFIGVAGMQYAAKVESRNYDVITASAITAESDIQKMIEGLKKRVNSKKFEKAYHPSLRHY